MHHTPNYTVKFYYNEVVGYKLYTQSEGKEALEIIC